MSCASNTLLLSCRPVLIMAGLPDDAKGNDTRSSVPAAESLY